MGRSMRHYHLICGFVIGIAAALGSASSVDGQTRRNPPVDESKVESRPAVRYVAIRTVSSMDDLPRVLPATWKEVYTWLKQRHVTPAGPPMIRYLVIDMPKRIEVEVGVPMHKAVEGEGRVKGGILPAGRYVTLTHVGPYDGMVKANADLQTWAEKRGIRWSMRPSNAGSVWAGRAEFYLRDPGNEKDPNKYKTEIYYLMRDDKRRGKE